MQINLLVCALRLHEVLIDSQIHRHTNTRQARRRIDNWNLAHSPLRYTHARVYTHAHRCRNHSAEVHNVTAMHLTTHAHRHVFTHTRALVHETRILRISMKNETWLCVCVRVCVCIPSEARNRFSPPAGGRHQHRSMTNRHLCTNSNISVDGIDGINFVASVDNYSLAGCDWPMPIVCELSSFVDN